MVGGDGSPRFVLAALVQVDPVPGACAFQERRLSERADLRAVPFGEGEVVEVERVLRADVAADVALAAVGAGASGNAEPIVSSVDVRVGEGDREVGPEQGVGPAEPVRGPLHPQGLRRQGAGAWVGRHRAHGEHVRGQVVVRVEERSPVRHGPGLFEYLRGRADRDVGVDQRAAAVAGGLDAEHVAVRADVVEAVLL
jgi:hypothetical protein